MNSFFKAGTSFVDISPCEGVELAGYPHFPRNNTGVHDPLYASCVYLNNGKTKVVIVSLDILFFSKKYVGIVRERVSKITDIPAKNIMICCTHTHSGPWASGRLDIEALEKRLKPDSVYISELIDKIVDVIVESYKNTFTAKIGMGKGNCGKERGVGGNRRDPDGITDPEVCVIGIQDMEGVLRAAIVKYALHPTVLHADNTLVSADYPGYIREFLLKEKKGMNMLFLQGTSGNQSTRYFRQGQSFKEAERIGYQIGAEASRILKTIKMCGICNLHVKSEEVNIKLREFPNKEEAQNAVAMASENYNQLINSGAGYIELQNANLKLLGAEDILGYILMLEKGDNIELLTDETPAEIQVIGINDGCIVGLPGEIFTEFGLDIKAKSPLEYTFVSELCNGCLPGYVYTKEALLTGGYETDTSMLSDETGEVFVKTALRIISENIENK